MRTAVTTIVSTLAAGVADKAVRGGATTASTGRAMASGAAETGMQKNDACCQYGCDVDLLERDLIESRADPIRSVLHPEVRSLPWFDDSEPESDPDTPSGTVVRTATYAGGCIFLAHDRRGCAIHRAAMEQGWNMSGTKPAVCRLFPLTYGDGAIFVSDDYVDYSCAYDASAPTLYRVARSALADLFGNELVIAMDAAEARIASQRLPMAASGEELGR